MTNLCGLCAHPIPEGAVSDYFCGPGHQDLWHRDRCEPLDEVRLYHRWRDQSVLIAEAMNDLRTAFTGFGEATKQTSDSLRRLENRLSDPR